jgi:hypothetical protein
MDVDTSCVPPAAWNSCLCRCVRPDEIIPMICYPSCPPPKGMGGWEGGFQGQGGGRMGGLYGVDDVLCADNIGPKDPMCGGWFGFYLDPSVAAEGEEEGEDY